MEFSTLIQKALNIKIQELFYFRCFFSHRKYSIFNDCYLILSEKAYTGPGEFLPALSVLVSSPMNNLA